MLVKPFILYRVIRRTLANVTSSRYVEFSSVKYQEVDEKKDEWQKDLHATMRIFHNFITPEEEDSLLAEVDPYMKRLRYEFSHWDDAIHGYRETERSQWNENNTKILDKVRKKAFPENTKQLMLVHVLDLAADGWIKPHVDSVRFCGEIIAGLSLLSDSVMRLTMVGQEGKYKESFLLPRRSLYIMSGTARYDYNHEVLKEEESYYKGEKIPRRRRISIICRCEPIRKND